jgi:hypothetical protein
MFPLSPERDDRQTKARLSRVSVMETRMQEDQGTIAIE